MKRVESVIATTHLDRQGDKLTRDALESLVGSISKSLIPINIEHDPRIPPIGRIVSGFVREREDNEYEAVAVMELFGEDDEPISSEDKREVVVKIYQQGPLHIFHDWAHRSPDDQCDIVAISRVFGTEPKYEVKKAADPIGLITIAGAFVLGGIASGFLKEIDSDGWKMVKPHLSSLFSRQRKDNGERLLSFSVTVEVDGIPIEINIIHTKPSADEISDFLDNGLAVLDSVLPIYLENAKDIRRLVFEAKGKDLQVKFAVGKDCRPLAPSISVQDIIEHGRKL